MKTTHVNHTISYKRRGYYELVHFIHEVSKIVADECVNYANLDDLPWYSTWKKWMEKQLLRNKTINGIASVICLELK